MSKSDQTSFEKTGPWKLLGIIQNIFTNCPKKTFSFYFIVESVFMFMLVT